MTKIGVKNNVNAVTSPEYKELKVKEQNVSGNLSLKFRIKQRSVFLLL